MTFARCLTRKSKNLSPISTGQQTKLVIHNFNFRNTTFYWTGYRFHIFASCAVRPSAPSELPWIDGSRYPSKPTGMGKQEREW